MLLEQMNWMQVEEYLKKDDRIVLVTGSTEQHGFNSIGTDTQIPWELAKEACEKTGVILAPVINYAFAGWTKNFPGNVSIRVDTVLALARDVLTSLYSNGFKRIVVLNGHGQNEMIRFVIEELSMEHQDINVKFRSWFMLPKTYKMIQDKGGTHWDHASWLESFPWINQPVKVPDKFKPVIDLEDYFTYGPDRVKEVMPEGVAGGYYIQDDAFMRKYYQTALEETIEVIEGGWDKVPPVV